jgi:hypothetical protein
VGPKGLVYGVNRGDTRLNWLPFVPVHIPFTVAHYPFCRNKPFFHSILQVRYTFGKGSVKLQMPPSYSSVIQVPSCNLIFEV